MRRSSEDNEKFSTIFLIRRALAGPLPARPVSPDLDYSTLRKRSRIVSTRAAHIGHNREADFHCDKDEYELALDACSLRCYILLRGARAVQGGYPSQACVKKCIGVDRGGQSDIINVGPVRRLNECQSVSMTSLSRDHISRP